MLTLKAKLVLLAIVAAILTAAGLYVNHLHGVIKEAQRENGALTSKLETANNEIKVLTGELATAQREIELVKKINTETDDIIRTQKKEYATLMGKYKEAVKKAPKPLPDSLVAAETPEEKENSLLRITLVWETHCLLFPDNQSCSPQENET